MPSLPRISALHPQRSTLVRIFVAPRAVVPWNGAASPLGFGVVDSHADVSPQFLLILLVVARTLGAVDAPLKVALMNCPA